MSKSDYKDFIEKSLHKASEIAISYFGNMSGVTTKPNDNNQVVTEADLLIGKYLIQEVRNKFPNNNIIDEEAGATNNNSEFTWVIDPIDGTSNFAQGIPLYGILLGLLYQGKPYAGGVALPSFKEIYFAERGQGAVCNGKPIHVTSETNLLSSLVAYSADGMQQHPEISREDGKILGEIILQIRNMRNSGSVFDGIMVAKGKYGGYLNRSSKIWDNVAMQVIIEEAGGIYTDFYGNEMNYIDAIGRSQDNFTFCIGAPELHKQLQAIIHSVV